MVDGDLRVLEARAAEDAAEEFVIEADVAAHGADCSVAARHGCGAWERKWTEGEKEDDCGSI